MERSGDPEEKEVWGTREELLLAFAVVRHGTRRWDFVATEIQSRASGSRSLTAQGCSQRFRDLQRRFGAGAVNGGVDDDGGGADVPWLEELRRRRVAELRREVDQYDFSIRSLQSKVKSLQEERERRLAESESGDGKPKYEGKDDAPPGSRPESLVGEPTSAGASGPSFERSYSTDPKEKHGEDGRKPHTAMAGDGEDVDAADLSSGGDDKAAEGSYNGSTGSPAEGRTSRRHATGEFTAESKSGEGEKESSDIQSSASLYRRRKAVSSSVVEETEDAEEASIMSKRVVAESQPLLAVLEIIRSDKYGSIFDRRFESQESAIYRALVRQPMDLETLRVKMDRAGSDRPYSTAEFFRDLLLLCTNAAVFYPRDSPESVAALHLRRVVTKEMAAVFPVPKELTPPPISLPPKPPVPMPEAEPEPGLDDALAEKPISSAPLIVCRKPSSISSKLGSEEMGDAEEEKLGPSRKESESEEKSLPKKITKDRSVLSGTTRGLRTSKPRVGKAQAAAAAKRLNLATVRNLKSKMVENEAAVDEPRKPDKKNGDGRTASTSSAAKKQSAAGFLNRMKRIPKGTSMDTSRTSPPPGPVSDGKATEQKEAKGKQQSASVAAVGGSRSSKKAADTSGGGSGKRSVGRPPKRGSAVTLPPVKRAREEAEPPSITRSPASTSRKRGRRGGWPTSTRREKNTLI